ncbi:MAG: helix-turn-helix transcriptional regulator [Eubacteriales bacterium]|nr:helix-turn-helix transcriptional regulator [Eubacteriales bacterium]
MKTEKIVTDDEKNVIGRNIRRFRISQNMLQTEMIARLQLYQVSITREALVKIEGGRQHIKLSQLQGIKKVLGVSYDDLLEERA